MTDLEAEILMLIKQLPVEEQENQRDRLKLVIWSYDVDNEIEALSA